MTVVLTKSERMRCATCGTNAACDCNAEYIPAAEYARRAMDRSPEKSNRALAAEAGVSPDTVDRLRRSGARNQAPEIDSQNQSSMPKVVGIDGKTYPGGATPPQPQRASRQVPFKRQLAVRQFHNALLKLSYPQKCWVWKNILPHYDPN